MDFSGRTVLVVGGAGYVGSVLVTELLRAGAEVRVLDQLIYDNGFALAHLLDDPHLRFQRGDLRSRHDLAEAAAGATDLVLLASLVGDPICKAYPELAREINENGAKRVVDHLDDMGIRRFVFTSTCSNYGIHESSRLATEESELNPQSLYAHTKIEVEKHVLDRAGELASATTVLRIATAYGLSPRMRFDLTVSQFAWELATGRPLQVYDADTWRPYCHVRDICKAIMTMLTSDGKRHPRRSLQRRRHLPAVHQAHGRRRGPAARAGRPGHLRGQGLRPAQLPRVIRQDRRDCWISVAITRCKIISRA